MTAVEVCPICDIAGCRHIRERKAQMNDSDLTITIYIDRPFSGMWHCGPNACWVTVKHNPTQIMARAFHRQQYKAREIALACVELMVAECGIDTPQFPEATK